MREIHDDHDIIAWAALVPTMIGNHVVGLILMEDIHSGSRETASTTRPVEAKMNQVAIHAHQAAELLGLVPVQGNRILEPAVFQELLSLEQHRYARRREHQSRRQRRAFLGEPVVGILGIDF